MYDYDDRIPFLYSKASEQSFLKNSICTDEMNCPLGTSTPTSDDDFNTPLVPNNTQEFSRNVPYNRSLR